MSSLLFIITIGSLFATAFGLSWVTPVTLAILCVASNIDDLRKQAKGEPQQTYVQKRTVEYDPQEPVQHIDIRR